MNRIRSHRRVLVGGVLCALSMISIWHPPALFSQAPSGGELRAFTDKQGRKLEAQIISISADRRMMKIAQPDGREFELEILKLSLDDQQYLKNWIATRSTQIEYRLEVAIEKLTIKSSDRRKDGDYKMTTEYPGFRVTVKNVSRETLKGPVIEYFLLKKEGVRIYQNTDTKEWDYTRRSVGEEITEKTRDVIKLTDLLYNREQVVTTKPFEIDRVLGDGNYVYGEDEVLGMILQVRDEFGNVVGVFRSSDAGVKNVKWESLAAENPQDASSASTVPSVPTSRQLTEIPETFKKGDFMAVDDSPRIDGKPFKVSGEIEIDASQPNGTIIAMGGKNKGFGLVVADGELQFWMRSTDSLKGDMKGTIVVSQAELPGELFHVEAEYTAEAMKISIDGKLVAEGPSIGLLELMPFEGLSVGFDEGTQSVGPSPPPNHFAGVIRALKLTVGD